MTEPGDRGRFQIALGTKAAVQDHWADELAPNHGRIYWPLSAGIVAAVGAVALAEWAGTPGDPAALGAIAIGLGAAAILLVPVSIFAALLAGMFPAFNRATPVVLVRQSPAAAPLTLTVAVLGFGVTSLAVDQVFPTTLVTALVFAILVGVAALFSVRLVQVSLRVMDPVGLAEWIAESVPKPVGPFERGHRRRVNAAWGDLCRLARGYNDAQRIEAAAQVLSIQARFHGRHHRVISAERRNLCERVLGECLASAHPTLVRSVGRFSEATGIVPDLDACTRRWSSLAAPPSPAAEPVALVKLGPVRLEILRRHADSAQPPSPCHHGSST